ncbi:hydrogenase maturation protease [Orenia metallireducens]|uniref:Hydrogenase maturation protease n=1 Tax=Orenia metallireducens TaxID=1413210 RepID=A0A1C0ABI4_9FIRM|nr:HyaD/HybD family hydrogenase maturation endopeptidase [Orenia metallireducens]OCL27745.1 hydrogenase maturation protease [Orenia metallireducens]
MKAIAILGIGNLLLRDDGVGIHVINKLEDLDFPENIEIIDGGTSVFDLVDVFVKKDKVIIVDCLKGGHQPATIYRITPEEMGGYISESSSLHDVQIMDIVKKVELMGYSPEVVIIGVEPKEVYYDLELSPEIRAEIPTIIDIVKNELKKEGIGDF